MPDCCLFLGLVRFDEFIFGNEIDWMLLEVAFNNIHMPHKTGIFTYTWLKFMVID